MTMDQDMLENIHWNEGYDAALLAVREELKGLPRGDHSANYFVDHIVEDWFGKDGQFEMKE